MQYLLKKLRLEAKLSQGDISEKLNYSTPQFISNWERGISCPPVSSLKRLAKLLGVEASMLLEEMIKYEQSELEKNLRAKFKRST